MLGYLVFFALIAMVIYYGYHAFKILKDYIERKRAVREEFLKTVQNDNSQLDTDEQTHAE